MSWPEVTAFLSSLTERGATAAPRHEDDDDLTHVVNQGGRGVRNPLDQLGPDPGRG